MVHKSGDQKLGNSSPIQSLEEGFQLVSLCPIYPIMETLLERSKLLRHAREQLVELLEDLAELGLPDLHVRAASHRLTSKTRSSL